MEEVEIKHFGSEELGCQQQNETCKNEEKAGGSHSQQSGGPCMLKQESNEAEATELLEKGFMEYGCLHYRRRCRIRAPCCGEIFDCRHCHNEAKNNINVDQKLRHDIPRHQISQVICSLCGTEQEVFMCGRNDGISDDRKKSNKSALTVVYVWENISVRPANFLTMIHRRDSIIVTVAESVGMVFMPVLYAFMFYVQ
ncbi:hypothetical protein POUND7_010262 [Theobroma cacao]